MNAARIELALVLQKLGLVPLELETFAKRSALHWRIYLAQIVGADLGYHYAWLPDGPFCRMLRWDALLLRDEIADGELDFDEYDLRARVAVCLEQAPELWAKADEFEGTDGDWLELLASMHYVRHMVYQPGGVRPGFGEAFDLLLLAKPRFAERSSDAWRSWQRLNEFGLIQTKTLELERPAVANSGRM